MKYRLLLILVVFAGTAIFGFGQNNRGASDQRYKLLATTKTSTMQKELNKTSAEGYRVLAGSRTSDSEMAVFLSKDGSVLSFGAMFRTPPPATDLSFMIAAYSGAFSKFNFLEGLDIPTNPV